jgi:hypothetical protein
MPAGSRASLGLQSPNRRGKEREVHRKLRSLFEYSREDFYDEDQELVLDLFRQLGRTIPLWLAPWFLEELVCAASVEDYQISRRKAHCTDPNG